MAPSDEESYRQLISSDGFATTDVAELLRRLGCLIDLSEQLKHPEGIDRALTVGTDLSKQPLRSAQSALLHYFSANAWSHRWQLKGGDHASWEQRELEREILELRLAAGLAETLPKIRRCQIFTNLGNALSRVGRFIEAIQSYDRALAIDSEFGRAVGNRAIELTWYARLAPQRHDRIVLFQESYAELQRVRLLKMEGHARTAFVEHQLMVERLVPSEVLQRRHDLGKGKLGRSREERTYRQWSLKHRLFLHPVNDIGPFPSAATDPISLSGVRTPLDKGPNLLGLFNQLKQEFVSARYMLFASTQRNGVHFADRGVLLTDTLDYPSYSFATEQLKASFRIAYSLLDKIGFFLNDYLALGIGERNVTFRTLWYTEKKALRLGLQSLQNFPLRALFWLAKDLDEKDSSGLAAALEPDARQLAHIRNHLEHKYLKLHLPDWQGPPPDNAFARLLTDTLALSMGRNDFSAKAIRLLQLARAALVYLACAVRVHEGQKAKHDPEKVAIMELPTCEDRWKH